MTILPTNTAGFEQVFEVSVVSGYTCPGNMTVTAGVDIDGITETLAPLTFPLSTNAGSISAVYYGLTITPQILTMAAFVTNQVASTSVDFVYTYVHRLGLRVTDFVIVLRSRRLVHYRHAALRSLLYNPRATA